MLAGQESFRCNAARRTARTACAGIRQPEHGFEGRREFAHQCALERIPSRASPHHASPSYSERCEATDERHRVVACEQLTMVADADSFERERIEEFRLPLLPQRRPVGIRQFNRAKRVHSTRTRVRVGPRAPGFAEAHTQRRAAKM